MIKFIAAATAIFALAAACRAENVGVRLTPEQLAQDKRQLLGATVEVDGCIYVHRHGMQVGPCSKHDWRQITSVTDPEGRVPEAFQKVGKFPSGSLKARFVGQIVEEEYEWPKHGVQPALKIKSISNVHATGP